VCYAFHQLFHPKPATLEGRPTLIGLNASCA
jgi:hypothetical protein